MLVVHPQFNLVFKVGQSFVAPLVPSLNSGLGSWEKLSQHVYVLFVHCFDKNEEAEPRAKYISRVLVLKE